MNDESLGAACSIPRPATPHSVAILRNLWPDELLIRSHDQLAETAARWRLSLLLT